MSTGLLVVIALVTVGSRTLALAFLPTPSGRALDVIERMPAPLFASLAVLAATDAARSAEGAPVGLFVACGCAMAVSGRRSLALVLVAGLTGFALTLAAQL